MIEIWGFRENRLAILMVLMSLLYQNPILCWSLNDEGLALLRFKERVVTDPSGALSNWNDDVGVIDPCSWFGVECSDGSVAVLNMKDLCLGGTLSPNLGNLVHIKSIILRNNSFSGIIPKELGKLKELEMLDLGYNNFSGPLPSDLGNNLSLTILLLDSNDLLGSISPEMHELKIISEVQVDENQLSNSAQRSSCSEKSISWNSAKTGDEAHRRLLEVRGGDRPIIRPPSLRRPSDSPRLRPLRFSSPSPSPEHPSHSPTPSPAPAASAPPPSLSALKPSPVESSSITVKSSHPIDHRALILSVIIGGSVLLVILVAAIVLCQGNKVAVVKPWFTGLSGQLQKAFVTGVPKLKRSELETACEDFSNVVGASPIGTVYKGTLSNAVEIAVISVAISSAKDWSNNLETQFRNKIDTLSKVNHKNFVNLLGYCEEDEPFTRMLVFEYAPNGTLFEHIHMKEAEHLDWGMRMRIIMGMAYCLDHMHQLTPIAHKNLTSSAVHLTEDYAAKVSDFGFWNEVVAAELESSPERNLYSFGVILFEMITGRLPFSVDRGSLEDWASDYLKGAQPLREMVDPTLTSFKTEQLEDIAQVIRSCVLPDPKQRPTMREVVARLRVVTSIGPDGATPKLSPLWWAELEILPTTEAS